MITTVAAALTTLAFVTQDQVALRAAPRDSAQTQAVMWQGDSLEIRGEKGDFLQVWDHRRERGGYIRATQVRVQSLKPENAAELLSVVRFLRDTPGSEALGISYTAAYLKAAPADAITAEPFDALGTMAERLARRVSYRNNPAAKQNKTVDTVVAGHLEVVANYGVDMVSFDRNGQMQVCYNGDAFRRVLALPSTDTQKARAALALTKPECLSPSLTPVERNATDTWRADVLERVDLKNLPETLKNRMHLRKAGVWASLAYQKARKGEAVADAANRSLQELAAVNKSELTEDDTTAYTEAAVRVGASRWGAEPGLPANPTKLSIVTTPGQPGETCVHLIDPKIGQKAPLFTRCTYGIVWNASATPNSNNTALALAVQPVDTWREMWVFRKDAEGWKLDVVPPGLDNPDLGYVEFAGWVPGGTQMLAARESRLDGRFKQSFELIKMSTLETEKQADKPGSLSLFYRWQDPQWKRATVSVR